MSILSRDKPHSHPENKGKKFRAGIYLAECCPLSIDPANFHVPVMGCRLI